MKKQKLLSLLTSYILVFIFSFFFVSISSSYAATCQETATTNGQDDGPTTTLINSFPCTGGGAITAMTLDASIGGSCPGWYDYDIYINGGLAFSNQCNQTALDISIYLPITSVELRSRDNDVYSDNINLTLTLNITYTAGPMVYSSCTTTQGNTTTVAPGATDQEIIAIEVVTTGDTGPFDVTQLRLRTNGTDDYATDISGNIKVYYTGTSSTFATTTLFGTAAPLAPGNNIFVNGTQALVSGTNYFWVAYDIATGATLNNFVDALCNRVTINGGVGNKTPTVTNPAGNREIDIVYCTSNATSSGDSELDNVVLIGDINTISNNTASTCAQYSDFTGLTPAELTPAAGYQVDVTLGTCGGNYTKYGRVFIDWNHDGDFADANEDLGEQGGVTATTTYNFNFTVPAGATIGNTVMRVICKEGSGITSCGTYSYGETEDYTVTIVTPGPMSYTSCTTTQANTSSVSACSGNQEIIGIEVNMNGVLTPLDLTQIRMNMTGTSNVADLSNIDIYYTGTSSTFAATNLFASATPAGGTFNVNGTQTLSSGTNYFWIAYDLAIGATPTNNLDAQCVRITVDGVNRFPTVTSPAGNRTITPCIISPGGVSDNITAWFDASNGTSTTTDGAAMGTWSNNAANPGVPTITSAGTARPKFQDNEINFNPVIEFDGVDDYLDQTSTLGSDLFGVAGNTIFMVHRFRSGLVYFKWEQGPTSSPRVGFESSGGKVRFDFPNDNAASQAVGTTNFSGVGEIVTAHHSSNLSTLRVNGVQDITKTTSGTLNNSTNQQFIIAANDFGNPLGFCNMDYAELIIYKTGLSAADMNRVESYMAIKYGVTLGGNAATGISYSSTYGTSVWDENTGYHYDVTGIAKDLTTQTLDQPKSKTINTGSVMPFTIAHSSIASPTSLSADNAYLIVGHDNGVVNNNPLVSYTHAATAIQVRLKRVFRIQTTNLPTGKAINEMEIELDMSNVPGLTGGTGLGAINAASDLRLLLDDNTTFGQATANERAYTNSGVSGNLIKFKIPFSDLPANGVYYFTIGSVNRAAAPLPVNLLTFTGDCKNNSVELNWVTSSEINNDYFTIEKSEDGVNFSIAATIDGNGNKSTSISYTWLDDNPTETTYYRLKQTDFNGESKYFNTVFTTCKEDLLINVYPNPVKDHLVVEIPVIGEQYNITVKDNLGRLIINENVGNESRKHILNLNKVKDKGIYFITIYNNTGKSIFHEKLIKL